MGFSSDWDQLYAANTHLSIWPWSDVVSLVHRHCKSIIQSRAGRVYELGCGAGANIPLFLALGFDYFAIEGSPTIVEKLRLRFPDLEDNIIVGDFTADELSCGSFDLVVDRASVTHNSTPAIISALRLAFEQLNPGGIFLGIDWFSVNHSDYLLGTPADDEYTRFGHSQGQFLGTGKVHFSDEKHLRELFSKYEIVFLEEKINRCHQPRDSHQFASWNIVARRPL